MEKESEQIKKRGFEREKRYRKYLEKKHKTNRKKMEVKND